jgi:hypothetical protein
LRRPRIGAPCKTPPTNLIVFDLEPAIHTDEHALDQHASINAVAHGVGA